LAILVGIVLLTYSQRQVNVYTSTERSFASHVDVTVTSAYWLS